MTREELHAEVAALTGEIVGMVSDLSPFDYKRKAEIDREILALFDRYEAEQWSKPGEKPLGGQHVLARWQLPNGTYQHSVEWMNVNGSWPKHWRFRELPAPPKE